MESSSQRIASLDGLRAVSIILVLAGHLFYVVGLGDLGNLGNLGVRVFFVISGYLITGILVNEIERTSKIDLIKFYFRRTLRIFPPYYFYLIVIAIAGAIGSATVSNRSIALSAVYLTDYLNPSNWLLGHTWSLAVEEQFYLLLPGILVLLGIRRTKFFLLAVVVLMPFVRLADFRFSGPEQLWVLKGFHANSDALAIGCLLTLFRETLHANKLYQKFLSSGLIYLLPVVIVAFNVQQSHPHLFYGLSISIMNISIALGIDSAVTNSRSAVGNLLNWPPLAKLGVMSYSVYLWQQPFFNPGVHGPITQFPLNFVGLAIMATASYYLVEKYSMKFRRHLESHRVIPPKGIPLSNVELSTTVAEGR